jgi:hypothetical protein
LSRSPCSATRCSSSRSGRTRATRRALSSTATRLRPCLRSARSWGRSSACARSRAGLVRASVPVRRLSTWRKPVSLRPRFWRPVRAWG